MERNIKNPSLVPEWFIYSGSKVMGVSGADGRQYYFVGSSEKGEDGKTPDIRINAEKGYIWESRYAPDNWNEIPGSPAASGLVGPQGEIGPSGDSVKVKSIVNENSGTTVTLAWGENFEETSSFFVPSGLSGANGKDGTDGIDGQNGISPTVTTATIEGTPGGIQVTISGADGKHQFDIMNGKDGAGASYSFDGTTLSGNGNIDDPIGVNTTASMNFINSSAKSATYADQYFDITDDKYYSISQQFNNKVDKPDTTQVELNNKYLIYSTLSADGQPKGWIDMQTKVYSKSEADGTFQKKTDMGGYLTTAQYATDSATFVTSGDYISGSKQYALTSGGWKEISANTNYTAGTDLKIDENNVISVDTNGNANNTATNNRNFVEGSWTIASGYNCHAEGVATSALGYSVYAQGMWTCFSSTDGQTNAGLAPIYWGIGAGAAVEGYCNATTSCPMSGTAGESNYGAVHGGIIKVIGNGYVENEVHETDVHEHYPSDALILYRDGSMMVKGPITANGVELGNYTPTLPLNIYGTATNTVTNDSIGAIGNKCVVGQKSFAMSVKGANASGNAFAFGDDNVAYDNSLAFGWGTSATNYSFAGGQALSANNRSVALGNGNIADYRSFAFGDANTATYWSVAAGRGLAIQGSTNASTGFGGLVIGGWNRTSADALFVAGNGTGNGNSRSDALVLTRDGKLTTNKVYVSGTNFDTLGQSRLDGNNTCLGTNWMGVSQSHAGFLKYIDGQNPGDTEISNNGSGIQFEFKPNNTQGDLSVINTYNGTSTTTKVVNVPQTSYNNMSSFDNTNGPNYMLRKTASGFDIGAMVINVTALPQNTEANAYYFVYDL